MLKYRLPSGIALLSLLSLSIFWQSNAGRMIFMVFGISMVFLGVIEFLRMMDKSGHPGYPRATALLGGIGLCSIFFVKDITNVTLPLFIAAILAPWLMLLFSKTQEVVLHKVMTSVASFFMIVLPMSFLALIYMIGEPICDQAGDYAGRSLVLFMILVTKCGDIGAYFTGTLSNKITKGKNHKIVPSISPKKSWEGTIGGAVLSIAVSLLLTGVLLPSIGNVFSMWQAAVVGLVLFIGGFTGDLVESSLKRITGVKDSGAVLPGMGGVLDVIDSLLLNAPVFYYIIKYVC